MKVSKNWFDADVAGLSKLVAHRPKSFILHELVSNALDEATTRIEVLLEKVPGRPLARVVVRDDNPAGFADLSHAYRLFAESMKKDKPELRGRFCMGEKLLLSQASEAVIRTTTGVVEFAADGTRREHRRGVTERGSEFSALVRMTQHEFEEALQEARAILVPPGVRLTLNGEALASRTPLRTAVATLPTMIADAEGNLRPSKRQTTIEIYEPAPGERARIYELGIPVVESGDRFHANVLQKIPLNMERDNVSAAFLQALRTHVANATADLLDAEDATAVWVDQALRDPRLEEEAVRSLVRQRFGEKVVSADPKDPEAVSRAVAHGYRVLHGGMLSGEQWENLRRAEAVLPAGRLFPTHKPYSDDPDAKPAEMVPVSEWTVAMREVVDFTRMLARRLMGIDITVRIMRELNDNCRAGYGARTLDFSLRGCGRAFFEEWRTRAGMVRLVDVLLDEFGHEYAANHLSEDYYRALRRLGAECYVLGLTEHAHLPSVTS